MTYLVYHDSLSGIYERNFLFRRLEEELLFIKRYGHEVVIIIFDINDFKKVNDIHGYLAEDEVFNQIAQIEKSCTIIRHLCTSWRGRIRYFGIKTFVGRRV